MGCKQKISRLAVCDTDQKEMTIDETYCWSTDHLGRPIDIYSDPDYRMQCIGYWKENLKSYLITYDQLDAFTNYRCWVYQRADLNRMLMSMSVGPFCDLAQDVDSSNWTQGAVVSLRLEENHIRVFRFDETDYSHSSVFLPSIFAITTPA